MAAVSYGKRSRWPAVAGCILVALVPVLGPGLARSGVLELGWETCGNTTPADLRFACDRNEGSHVLVGSFRPTSPIARFDGFWAQVQVCFPGGAIPDWWRMVNAGSCRPGSASANFTAPAGECADDYSTVRGAVGAVVGWWTGDPGSNTFAMVLQARVDSSRADPLVLGTDYFLFNLVIDDARTIGSSPCSGCLEPAAITFAWLQTDVGVGISGGGPGSVVTWQGPTSTCYAAIPVRGRTWGAVKALYR